MLPCIYLVVDWECWGPPSFPRPHSEQQYSRLVALDMIEFKSIMLLVLYLCHLDFLFVWLIFSFYLLLPSFGLNILKNYFISTIDLLVLPLRYCSSFSGIYTFQYHCLPSSNITLLHVLYKNLTVVYLWSSLSFCSLLHVS